MNETNDLSALISEISMFKREPDPTPWNGRLFRDLTGQQTDIFTMEGSVGSFMDYYVLSRERADGSGTRIIRHRDQVEPAGTDAPDTLWLVQTYHSSMDVLNVGVKVVSAGRSQHDQDVLEPLLIAAANFEELERYQEMSTVLSLCAEIHERNSSPTSALELRRKALAVSQKEYANPSVQTLKRKYQVASTLIKQGEEREALHLFQEIKEDSRHLEEKAEAAETLIACGIEQAQLYAKSGEFAKAESEFDSTYNLAVDLLGRDHQFAQFAKAIKQQTIGRL